MPTNEEYKKMYEDLREKKRLLLLKRDGLLEEINKKKEDLDSIGNILHSLLLIEFPKSGDDYVVEFALLLVPMVRNVFLKAYAELDCDKEKVVDISQKVCALMCAGALYVEEKVHKND